MAGTRYEPLSQGDGEVNDQPRSVSFAHNFVRPHTYYGEGPFSPPDSVDGDHSEGEEDGEDFKLLEKRRNMLRSGRRDEENLNPDYLPPFEGNDGLVVGSETRFTPLRWLLTALGGLLLLATVIGVIAAHSYNGTTFRASGVKPLTMDHIFNGTFSVNRQYLNWVREAGDGIYSTREGGDIVLHDIRTNSSKILVQRKKVKDEHGSPLYWDNWKLSPDMKYLLVKADVRKQWRHSSFGNYYIYSLETGETRALIPPTSPPIVAYATWSPTGESIAYVASNDLYVLQSPEEGTKPIRVTSNGNSSLFNGVPDWVYEEEVFSSDNALWWSPDSTKLAFLRLDETKVPTYTFPVYNPTQDSHTIRPYTDFVTMKYPKPGYPNPLVSVHLFELDKYTSEKPVETIELGWDGRKPVEDSVITEVTWVGNRSLILKEVNRSADDGSVVLFDLDNASFNVNTGKGRVVRKLGKEGEQGDNGWIDAEQTVYPLISAPGEPTAYLDIVPTPEGYNHIALFSPADSSVPRWLTTGEWEVHGGVQSVDQEKGVVYFVASATSSIERHVYSIPLPSAKSPPTTSLPVPTKPTPLTDDAQSAWYSVNFSPFGGYYLLGYDGPNIPWQRVISISNNTLDYQLTSNAQLNYTSSLYQAPIITRSTINVPASLDSSSSETVTLNTLEIRPPSMDDSGRTKYPVLFRVYGGPNSQMVHTRWERDWHHYLSCGLKYVVVVVDGRGTAAKGRKFRNWVRGNLGYWETRDQVAAARIWASKRYVDPHRIGIWGWSYGGFMTTKVLESDAGIHSLGMAVAPVISWKMYDSIYTERYMGLPQVNPDGYFNASVTNVTAFGREGLNFLLAHGSGDDNVHFANSAHLLDMFTEERVRGFEFRMFTDSDHSIGKRGAYRELFEWMTEFLIDRWGKGGIRRSG